MSGHIIRLVDLETTGMEPPAEVCELGYCDLTQQPDGTWRVGEPVSKHYGVASMPPEVRAVHWITAAEVAGLAPFDAAEVGAWDHCAAIGAHNAEFEERFLRVDGVMPMICTLKAAYRVWPQAPGHSNSVLRCWLEDEGLISLDHEKAMPPHRAGPDAYVSAHILKALFAAGATGREMIAWTREPKAFPTCPIGEHRGKPWADVDAGFLRWMINKPVEADLVWNARRELDRRAA